VCTYIAAERGIVYRLFEIFSTSHLFVIRTTIKTSLKSDRPVS